MSAGGKGYLDGMTKASTPTRTPHRRVSAQEGAAKDDAPSDSVPDPVRPLHGQKFRPPDMRVSLQARQAMYERFRAHTDEVLAKLLRILRDDDADDGHIIAAGREILNRGWGTVPQHHIVEQTFEHHITINAGALRSMTPGQLTDLEATLARLVEVPESQVIEADVVQDDS